MQENRYPKYLSGYFLIADTELRDPNFYRTVVFMVEHNSDGALGLIINRPSNLLLGSVLPESAETPLAERQVLIGGPVQREYLFLLHGALPGLSLGEHALTPAEGVIYQPVTRLLIQQLIRIWPDLTASERDEILFFAGYSGWGENQLESELLTSCWILNPADNEILFSGEPGRCWEDALSSKGGIYTVIARTGFKPSLN